MFFRILLRICSVLVNGMIVIALLLSGSYAGYALWDNNQVLSQASNVRADLLRLKPSTETAGEAADNGLTFSQLLEINPDVCGWITLDYTGIDFPVLHGETNLSYINTDVYGNFSLAGSIFLDCRNASDFSQGYTLLYGHHMADGNMFGDLDRYKEASFFWENRTGTLILPERTYELDIISCMVTKASDENIFDPDAVQDAIPALLDYAREKALYLREDAAVLAEKTGKIIALSTCSSEYTDARTIVLAAMQPKLPKE